MVFMAVAYEDLPIREDGFTVDDLAEMPDDGRLYELVDGVLLVSPAPRWEHQVGCGELTMLLRGACPSDLYVFGPTPDVRKGRRTSVQPDICVVHRTDLVRGERYLAVPVLVVEVLSPSSVGIDRLLKRDVYARLGVPHYWIVDTDKPSITTLALTGTDYLETGTAHGNQPLKITDPFPLTITPSQLVLT
ncbi:Uma2 family endonuclease [Candidatus Protofrankia californiensis]|uniref:Uma2 family endonuclease n=1 Tax=Candidatus Protofrankia californiensis TaxID=1839754 RepID=UPI0010413209|nr:Uma2 family endonuclease [Candidatus Protofrankia californiensis]